MDSLPEPARVVQLPDGTYHYTDALPAHVQERMSPQVIHQHIHQAAPDRTVQRLALGSGAGAGAVAAGVYFGPLLIGALTAIAAYLALLLLMVLVLAWAVVHVVTATSGGAKSGRRKRS